MIFVIFVIFPRGECDNDISSGFVQLAASVEGGHHSGHSGHKAPHTDKLWVFPWQIYPDMVVFDWLIRLADKDR